jgi:serine acetyltransferase
LTKAVSLAESADVGGGNVLMMNCVMFGRSARFGDYVDLVHILGGSISKVVVNVPDRSKPGGKSFDERVASYRERRLEWGIEGDVVVEALRDFRPGESERYFFGFAGLGQLVLRDYLVERWGLEFSHLIHPSAAISPSASIGGGTVVYAGAVIGSETQLGDFCRIGRGATVGHDVRLEECAHIAPGANVASGVLARRGANVGLGANVLENTVLGAESTVAGGAFVRSEVPARTLVAGVPAVIKKEYPARVWPDRPPGVS